MYKFASIFVIVVAIANLIFQIFFLFLFSTLFFGLSFILAIIILFASIKAQTNKNWIYILFVCAAIIIIVLSKNIPIYVFVGMWLAITSGLLFLSFPKQNSEKKIFSPSITWKTIVITLLLLFGLYYIVQVITMHYFTNVPQY